MNNDLVKISKTMSCILRHRAIDMNLNMDSSGRILLKDLLNTREMKKLNVTESIIKHIVDTNDKKRFSLEIIDGNLYIKANQGHSERFSNIIEDEKLLTKITIPCKAVHGTNRESYQKIKISGLKPMGRMHVHFASENGVSGIRKYSNVLIEIDMKKAMEDGIDFFRSDNGVILTKTTILPKYFKNINFV